MEEAGGATGGREGAGSGTGITSGAGGSLRTNIDLKVSVKPRRIGAGTAGAEEMPGETGEISGETASTP